MKNNNNLYKLGIFVFVGLLLLAGAIYIIGAQKNLFTPTFKVSTVFTNVSGLKVGNNVRFSGINVGTINAVQITSDTTVRVDLIIQKDVQKFIRKDSKTTIGSDGLMGDKVMTITPGSSDQAQAEENDFLLSEVPTSMDDIIASAKVSAENIEVITDQLALITYDINHGKGIISKMIKDEKFASTLNTTMSNLQQGTKALGENMEAAKSSFLLRGAFKRKKRAEEKQQKEADKPVQKPIVKQ